jgi:hypothetical protein
MRTLDAITADILAELRSNPQFSRVCNDELVADAKTLGISITELAKTRSLALEIKISVDRIDKEQANSSKENDGFLTKWLKAVTGNLK